MVGEASIWFVGTVFFGSSLSKVGSVVGTISGVPFGLLVLVSFGSAMDVVGGFWLRKFVLGSAAGAVSVVLFFWFTGVA